MNETGTVAQSRAAAAQQTRAAATAEPSAGSADRAGKRSAATLYTLWGLLFGVAFPLGCLLLLGATGRLRTGGGLWELLVAAHADHTLLYVIDSAPLFLGLFARFAGVRQDRIARFNESLEEQVAEKTQNLWRALDDARQAHQTVLHMAHHDALTGLPNRSLLRQRLDLAIAGARSGGTQAALVFFDLDRFKAINDTLGHEAGDDLLREVADRLQLGVRHGDTVARLGGDEFVIVLACLSRPGDAAAVVGKLLDALAPPVTLAGREVRVTASVGVSLYPDHGEDADALMRSADSAMYRVKSAGRNSHQMFDPKTQALSERRLLISRGLHGVVDRGELRLHFQPQLDLHSNRVVATEALLRWQHPTLGLLPPLNFVPIAADSELIVDIGRWVLREACRQTRIWQDKGWSGLRVAVNVSAGQFWRGDLLSTVRAALDESGLPARCLELELTEAVLLNDSPEVLQSLSGLAALGVGIAVDDFGTGSASLGVLRRFPLRKLKIDNSFVQALAAEGKVGHEVGTAKAIIAMAKCLGLAVVAEGVETAVQLAFLRQEGCDEAQGFFIGRPLPAHEALGAGPAWSPPALPAATAPLLPPVQGAGDVVETAAQEG